MYFNISITPLVYPKLEFHLCPGCFSCHLFYIGVVWSWSHEVYPENYLRRLSHTNGGYIRERPTPQVQRLQGDSDPT